MIADGSSQRLLSSDWCRSGMRCRWLLWGQKRTPSHHSANDDFCRIQRRDCFVLESLRIAHITPPFRSQTCAPTGSMWKAFATGSCLCSHLNERAIRVELQNDLLAIDFDAWAPNNAHLLRYAQRQKRARAAGDNAEKVVRSCACLAAQLDLPWHAVHVETPKQHASQPSSTRRWSAR